VQIPPKVVFFLWSHTLDLNAPALHKQFNRGSHHMITLTQRETEILTLLLDGKADVDIAPLLSISAKTVSFHVENAKRKLGACHRVRAVALALRKGLIAFPHDFDDEPSGAAGAPPEAPSLLWDRPLSRVSPEAALIARLARRPRVSGERVSA
jgi:DNA-binding CsgD family transcriptional regulator